MCRHPSQVRSAPFGGLLAHRELRDAEIIVPAYSALRYDGGQVDGDLLASLRHLQGVEIDGRSLLALAGTLGEIIRQRRPAAEIYQDTIRRAGVHKGRLDLPGIGNRTQRKTESHKR